MLLIVEKIMFWCKEVIINFHNYLLYILIYLFQVDHNIESCSSEARVFSNNILSTIDDRLLYPLQIFIKCQYFISYQYFFSSLYNLYFMMIKYILIDIWSFFSSIFTLYICFLWWNFFVLKKLSKPLTLKTLPKPVYKIK